ncbi:MAG: DUF3098 domain-containing protein [Bacteroidales bacterium]|nr:DUF3098 domain-containing protein [Bacteroidales bacterium]MBD5229968.1 DUF3098 domain-containing protein [Bacteroidales bacterium]MBD5235086.1 DUF3098 domain-containing protein [Barnesiella sp.]
MAIPTKQQPARKATPATPYASRAAQKHTTERTLEKETPQQFPLARRNFILMIVAGLFIVVGFLLMLGGGTTPEKFNPDIFSTRRVVIGPTLAFIGFVAMGVAVIVRPKSKKSE